MGNLSFPRLKPFFNERIEIGGGDVPDGKGGSGVIEWVGRLEEDISHLVADASKKDVRGVGIKLDLGAKYGQNPLSLIYVEDVLEFIKEYAYSSAFCLRQKSIENGFKCRRVGGDLRVKRYRRRTGGGIDGNGRYDGNQLFSIAYRGLKEKLVPIIPTNGEIRRTKCDCRRRRSGCPTSKARSFCEAKVARDRAMPPSYVWEIEDEKAA